jgi:hypothetical protein
MRQQSGSDLSGRDKADVGLDLEVEMIAGQVAHEIFFHDHPDYAGYAATNGAVWPIVAELASLDVKARSTIWHVTASHGHFLVPIRSNAVAGDCASVIRRVVNVSLI